VDLGINVAVDAFVKKVADERPQVLALSALLTTTMPEMRKVIGALTQAGIRETIKVIVGGAPVNQNFANDVGADGYARDAAAAIDLVRSLIG
jgi:5-methyltetrahydrofolate--homocysteine methyltransferase